MDPNENWAQTFKSNLVAFQLQRSPKPRRDFFSFHQLPVDDSLAFIKNFYHLSVASHSGPITTLSLSTDESLLATLSSDHTIYIWSMQQKLRIGSIENMNKDIKVLRFTHDSQSLLMGNNSGQIHLYSLKSGRIEFTFEGHRGVIQEICLIPHSSLMISASRDIALIIWNLFTKRCEAYLKKHDQYVSCLCVAPNGKYAASGSWDKRVILWDVYKKNSVKILEGYDKVLNAVNFSPDSKVLAVAFSNFVSLYSLVDFTERQLVGHTYTVTKVLFSENELVISAAFDKTIKIWSIETCELQNTVQLNSNYCTAIAFAEKNKELLIGLNSGALKTVELQDGFKEAQFPGHNKVVFLVRIGNNFRVLASVCCLNTMIIWDLKLKSCLGCVVTQGDTVNCLDFSKDDLWLAAGFTSGRIEVWDLRTFGSKVVFEGNSMTVNFLMFWDEVWLASCSHAAEILFLNVSNGEKFNVVHGSKDFCVKLVKLNKVLVCQFKLNVIMCFKPSFPSLMLS